MTVEQQPSHRFLADRLPTGSSVSPAEARPGGGRLKDQAHQLIVIILASATLHYRGAIDSGGVALSWHVAGTGLRRHSRHLGKRCPNADMWEIVMVALDPPVDRGPGPEAEVRPAGAPRRFRSRVCGPEVPVR